MNLKQKLYSTKLIWRLSGLTYRTACIATNGRYVPKSKLVLSGTTLDEEIISILKYFNTEKDVLEFGSGIGENLFALSHNIKIGIGIDINYLYCRIANKLAKKFGIKNVNFIHYNGINFPDLQKFDIILEKSVFERVPKNLVESYLNTLRTKYLKRNGLMIVFFLMRSAMNSDFTKRLGNDSYVFLGRLRNPKSHK